MTPVPSAVEAAARTLGSEARTADPVAGGCISDARRVELADGRIVFVKSGAGLPAGILGAEAAGLAWLRETGAVQVPAVLALDEAAGFLALEWVEPGPRGVRTSERLGRSLAALHVCQAPSWGWHRAGFVGSLPMSNEPAPTWAEFWVEHRVRPFLEQAIAHGTVDPAARRFLGGVRTRALEFTGAQGTPARLHGDLWSGNVHVGSEGDPWLVDPAAYGGHPEVDLAMLDLFGGLDAACASAYGDVRPLDDGWRDRLPFWQVFPLLVHAVLFGGGYGERAVDVMARFDRR